MGFVLSQKWEKLVVFSFVIIQHEVIFEYPSPDLSYAELKQLGNQLPLGDRVMDIKCKILLGIIRMKMKSHIVSSDPLQDRVCIF